MRRYDHDTSTLRPEEYQTAADACEAWAAETAARGDSLTDRASMLTREGDAWTRWTMRRTGDAAPAPEWAVMRSHGCDAPEGYDD